jgi:hypothetical protein
VDGPQWPDTGVVPSVDETFVIGSSVAVP